MRVFQDPDGNPSGPHADAALADAVRLLSLAADAGEGHPPEHGARVASAAFKLGQAGGLSDEDLQATYYAGLLHEAGSLAIGATHGDSSAGFDRAGMLATWDHPAQGARICARLAALPARTADLVRWHHESWDGSGYPDQLRWNSIPKQAQFLRVADAFVSMMAPRPHREPRSAAEAYALVLEETGRDFSPVAVRAFGMCFRTMDAGLAEIVAAPGAPLSAAQTPAREVLVLLGELVDNRLQNQGRSARVAELADRTARKLAVDDAGRDLIAQAAAVFEIGTVAASHEAYLNLDGMSSLRRRERAKGAELAGELAGRTASYAPLAPILRAQQEWFDGTGFPDRLGGASIPLAARILNACAAYDTVERARTLRPLDRVEPLKALEASAGTIFDPAVITALLAVAPAPA